MDTSDNDQFESIRIETRVAKKFNEYCTRHSKSPSRTLQLMLEFFEGNGVSPEDDLGDTIASLKDHILRRSHTVIAIIKNLETEHLKPITAILLNLVGDMSKLESDAVVMADEADEVFDFGTPQLVSDEALDYYREAYYKTEQAYNNLQRDAHELLKGVKYVRNNFGSGYYRLELPPKAFETLKQKLKHVYQNNPAESER